MESSRIYFAMVEAKLVDAKYKKYQSKYEVELENPKKSPANTKVENEKVFTESKPEENPAKKLEELLTFKYKAQHYNVLVFLFFL